MVKDNLIFKHENLQALKDELLSSKNDAALFKNIVNLPFKYKLEVTKLSLGIIVLLQVNKTTSTIDRVALSENELAEGTKKMSAKRFENIRIPVGFKGNIISEAIETGKPLSTSDWQFLFAPELSPQESRFNQAGGGIAYSVVYPLKSRDGGALIFSFYQYFEEVTQGHHDFMKDYSRVVDSILNKKDRS